MVSVYADWIAAQVGIVSKSQNMELSSSDYDSAEFYGEKSEECLILVSPYLFERCWVLLQRLNMRRKGIREPRIDNQLVEQFPPFQGGRGVPLAIILNARIFTW